MTSAVLNNAACVIFLVSGAQKAGMLYTVLHGEYQPDQYPAQIARPVGENCRGS
jgi:6-phosphogluconolactonase